MSTPLGKKTFAEYKRAIKDAEVKLSNLKNIKLSVKGDIDAALGELRNEIKNATKFYSVSNNYISDQEDKLKDIRKNLVETENEAVETQNGIQAFKVLGNKAILEADSAAKELGLDPSDIPSYDELEELIADADELDLNMDEIRQSVQNVIVNL